MNIPLKRFFFIALAATWNLRSDVNAMVTNIRGAIEQINESANQFAEGARVIAESSQTLAQGAQSQSSGVEEMSASIEELARSVDAVSEVLRIKRDEIAPPPPTVAGLGREFLTGLVRLEKQLLILLDIDKILGKNGEEVMDAVATAY